MGFIMAHSKPVLIIILLITIGFALALPKLRIDANIFSYMTSVEPSVYVETPGAAPEKPLKLDGVNYTLDIPERGELVEMPEREKASLDAVYSPSLDDYVEMETGPTAIDRDWESTSRYKDGYVIIFSSERMFEPEVLNTIYSVRSQLAGRWEIGACLSPFDYVTVEKKGTRLSIVPIAPVSAGETWTDADAELFRTRLMKDSIAKNYLYTEDGTTIMIYYRARGLDETSIAELNAIVNPLRQYGRVALNGGGLLSNAVKAYLNRDLILLVALSYLVILAVYYLSFHSFKAMLVPASLSLIGIIWTMGTMALLGYKMTIVTILTPCLVLTLGSSYSIHMVSEYQEAVASGDREKLAGHYAKISKTIFFAMLTTIAGFLSFLVCRTKIFKDFGITVAIGVAFCGLLAFTYLPAILTVLRQDLKKKQIATLKSGLLAKTVNGIATVVTGRWYVFVALLLAIILAFGYVHDKIEFDSNYMNYLPRDAEIVQDSLYFARTLGGTDPYYFTIRAPEGSDKFFLKHENLELVYAYESAILAACPDLVQVLSFSQYVSFLNEVYNGTPGIPESNGLINLLSRTLMQISNQIGTNVLDMLIAEDGNSITLSMRNYDSVEGDLQTSGSARRIEQTLDYYRYMLPEGTTSRIWCSQSDSLRSVDLIMVDQNRATELALLLIFLLASLAFLSPGHGLLTLVPIVTGIMINYIFMYAFSIPFDMVTVGFSSVVVGAGVDDSIHFLLRYRMKRKERPDGSMKELLAENLRETGRPIILTTVCVDAGLVILFFASFIPVRYFGLLMCVALMAAMLATLCALPPVMLLIDWITSGIASRRKAANHQ